MNMDKFEKFERDVLTFLKHFAFSVVGYFTYPSYTDILGYMKPAPPFTVPTKVMVEVIGVKPTVGMIEGFVKLSRDSLSQKAAIFSIIPKNDLSEDVISAIERFGLEFMDADQVTKSIAGVKVEGLTQADTKKIYEVFSPPMLVKFLPEIAYQRIPAKISSVANELGLKAWQLFEQVVFSVFHYCFNFIVKNYGEDSLFQREPEGVAITHGEQPYAFIYECKSAEESYTMTSQDELTYIDYIRKKKNEVRVLEKVDLKYFLLISPEFRGDLNKRRENIFSETQVLPVFMSASALSVLGSWVCGLPNDIKMLLDFRNVFSVKESIVSLETIESYIKLFEDKTRKRY
nr:hypothetical protein [Candidatus Njordarchaeota archaeon]